MQREPDLNLRSEPFTLSGWWISPRECLIRDVSAPLSETRKVSPRAMEVLLYLADRAGLVVAPEEVLAALWHGSFTSANAVQKCIAELRDLLGDDARTPTILQTVPKRGYKLLVVPLAAANTAEPLDAVPTDSDDSRSAEMSASVTAGGTTAVRGPAALRSGVWVRRSVGIGLATLLASFAVVALFPAPVVPDRERDTASCAADDAAAEGECRDPAQTSVAVLRFTAADGEARHLADGLSSLLVDSLSRIKHLDVAARRDSFEESSARGSSREVGERLGVNHVLEGRVRVTPDVIEVAVQLVDVGSGKELYSERLRAPRSDGLDLQEHFGEPLMKALKIHLNDVDRKAMLLTGTRNIEAFLEHKRSFALVNAGSIDDLVRAAEHARRAVELDPEFIAAYRCLLIAYENMSTLELTVEQSESIRQKVNAIAAEVALAMPNSDLQRMSAFIASRLGTDQLGVVNYLIEGIKARERTSFAAAFGGMLIQAGLVEEGEAYQRDYQAEQGLPPGPSLYRILLEGGVEAVIARRVEILQTHPNHVVTLTGQIHDLARVDRFDEARELLARLEAADKEGLWAHTARHVLLMREGSMPKDGDRYREFMSHPLSVRVTRGHFALMYGDLAEGMSLWSDLSGIEFRTLVNNLRFMELEYPPEVLAHPAYQTGLDRLGLGLQWQRYLALRVAALAPITGVALTTVPDLQLAMGN
jgi:TolB-like protein/DNA-binding winged helix-turn-helix (wHTH) protein